MFVQRLTKLESIYVGRLTRLQLLLRADAANPKGVKFDLGMWAGIAGNDHVDPTSTTYQLPSYYFPVDEHGAVLVTPAMSCDTFACALGLACLDPGFQAEGLHFQTIPSASGHRATMVPEFSGESSFAAGAAFFGITPADSQYLFDPDCYDGTPKEAEGELFVAQRVEDLINGEIDMNYHPDRREDDEDEDDEL